jgi:hypothetical protein
MARALIIVVAILVAFLVYAVIDAILIDRSRIRGLPRALWVLICFVPALGGILWFFVGRGKANKNRPGSSGPFFGQGGRRTSAPDDDIDFLRGLNGPQPGEPRPEDDGAGSRG